MAREPLAVRVPSISKCFTTDKPYSVIDAPMRGTTRS